MTTLIYICVWTTRGESKVRRATNKKTTSKESRGTEVIMTKNIKMPSFMTPFTMQAVTRRTNVSLKYIKPCH